VSDRDEFLAPNDSPKSRSIPTRDKREAVPSFSLPFESENKFENVIQERNEGNHMASTLLLNELGNPELEQPLRYAIIEFLKQLPGDWQVSIIGSQETSAWEMRVSACAGDNARAKILPAKDGGHRIEKVVDEVRRMAELMTQSSAGPSAGSNAGASAGASAANA
jgi:hypothetical protein